MAMSNNHRVFHAFVTFVSMCCLTNIHPSGRGNRLRRNESQESVKHLWNSQRLSHSQHPPSRSHSVWSWGEPKRKKYVFIYIYFFAQQNQEPLSQQIKGQKSEGGRISLAPPLVNIPKKLWKITISHGKTHCFDWAIFNSYVSLPGRVVWEKTLTGNRSNRPNNIHLLK